MGLQEDFEIMDVEDYGNSKDSGFSHQQLVMMTMKKALENAGKELRAGFWETKTDKNGNLIRIYHEDSRLVFISSVEAVLMAMECDIDDDIDEDEWYDNKKKIYIARPEIEKILNSLEEKKQELLKAEEDEWNNLLPIIKQRLTENQRGFIKGYFNREKRFFQLYIEEMVIAYKEIMKCLSRLSKRQDFFKEELLSMKA